MAGQFLGKVAMVTGGSTGMGRATVLAFCKHGAKVVVADVNAKDGAETVRLVKEAKGEATFVKTDVSKAAEVQALINKVVETYGRLDYAHNNAGIAGPYPSMLADTSEEQFDQMININLKGIWLCLKYEILYMLKHGGGAIVNTSSTLGKRAAPRHAVYTATKHGVTGLTKAAAAGYYKSGIRINEVNPGGTYSAFTINAHIGGELKDIDERLKNGLLLDPEDVAEAVIWLCSDASRHVNGHSLVIDMGANIELVQPHK
jgi:NAD(P)-dependent dehydrogenase (short-subunit alcohol dehydrogenase family)